MEWKPIQECQPEDGDIKLGCINFFTTKAGHLMGGEIQLMKFTMDSWNRDSWIKHSGSIFYPTHYCDIPELPEKNEG